MTDPASWPAPLRDLLDTLAWLSPQEQYALLIEHADAFEPVPASIATPPYPEANRVPHCESGAYVWTVEDPEQHRVRCYFAVENPQGLTARAMAHILQTLCAQAPAWQLAALPDDLPQRLFGSRLSMGRTLGLNGLLARVKAAARAHVASCPACQAHLPRA